MEEAICCEFCDHEAVSIRMNGSFTCDYCGADHLLAEGWESLYDKESNHAIGNGDVQPVRTAAQVQVPGAAEAPAPKHQPGDGNSDSPGAAAQGPKGSEASHRRKLKGAHSS